MPSLLAAHATTVVEECPDAARKPNPGPMTTQRKFNAYSTAGPQKLFFRTFKFKAHSFHLQFDHFFLFITNE